MTEHEPTPDRNAATSADARSGPGPVFIGGTGRSGTWVLGNLLDRHPDLATISTEVRFHAVPGGFTELLAGERDIRTFVERMRTWWFRREGADGTPKGLHLLVDGEVFERALDELLSAWPRWRRRSLAHLVAAPGHRRPNVRASTPWRRAKAFVDEPRERRRVALGRLLAAFLDPIAADRGARTWVETTPRNVRAAPDLIEIFPDARVIHMVRDGRDVAASVVRLPWGPDDLLHALRWWGNRMLEAHRACAALGPDQLLVLRLEEFVSLDRERQFERLVSFIGGDPGDHMRRYFDQRIDGDRGHLGRYRSEVPADLLEEFEETYLAQLRKLRKARAACLPTLADELLAD